MEVADRLSLPIQFAKVYYHMAKPNTQWGCSARHWDVEGSITERKQRVGISRPVFYAIIHLTVPLWFGIWIVSGFNSHKSHCYKHC